MALFKESGRFDRSPALWSGLPRQSLGNPRLPGRFRIYFEEDYESIKE